jgi:hypothetical protein
MGQPNEFSDEQIDYIGGKTTSGRGDVQISKYIDGTDIENVFDTGFDDDSEIPSTMKGYIKAARDMGLISGSVNADGEYLFEPNREITRAEAALIVSKLVNAEVPTVKPIFPDRNEIPAWAHDAIYTLNNLGILNSVDGNISPSASLTRAQSAQMLCALRGYVD